MPVSNPAQVNWGAPGAIGETVANTVKATVLTVSATTPANSRVTGCAVFSGGVGISGNVFADSFVVLNGGACSFNGTSGLLRTAVSGNASVTCTHWTGIGDQISWRAYQSGGFYVGGTPSDPGSNNLVVQGGVQAKGGSIRFASFTVATVPSASANLSGIIYVSNESGGATLAFSDGTNWRRIHDRQIIS